MSTDINSVLWNVLYEESVDAIFIIDTDLYVLQANQKADQMFQIRTQVSLKSLFSKDSCVNLSSLVQSGFIGRCLVQLVDRKEQSFSLLATLVSDIVILQFLYLESKHPIRIHQRKALLGSFLGDIAHAMSNPLAVLQGRVELLLHKSANYPSNLKRHFSAMFDQCARISDLLQLIQILATKRMTNHNPVSINKMLSDYVEKKPKHPISFQASEDELVSAEPRHIHMLLDQLIHIFAEKIATSSSTDLIAHLKTKGTTICIHFEKPLEDSKLISILERKSVLETLPKGMDIRLLLCLILLEQQECQIHYEIKKSTFDLVLTFPHFVMKTQPTLRSFLRIMVVDDHSNLRETLSALLLKEGHQLAAVPSAEEAIAMLTQNSFDVIVTDIRLPGMSGIELYDLMLRSDPRTAQKMILISGMQQELGKRDIPFLRKPFSKDDLLEVMQKIIS